MGAHTPASSAGLSGLTASDGLSRRGDAVEVVAGTVRSRLQHGRYAAGQRLVEADLTRELKVSRGTVREALRRLAAEGLLDLQPNRGASVPGLSRSDVVELLEVLEGLVCTGAALAAQRIHQPGVRPRVRAALKATRAFRKRPAGELEVADCMEENGRFHAALARLSGNSMLARMVSHLQVHMFRLGYHNSRSRADPDRWAVNHEAILAAVLAGQPRRAASLMRQYCRRIRPVLAALAGPPPH